MVDGVVRLAPRVSADHPVEAANRIDEKGSELVEETARALRSVVEDLGGEAVLNLAERDPADRRREHVVVRHALRLAGHLPLEGPGGGDERGWPEAHAVRAARVVRSEERRV